MKNVKLLELIFLFLALPILLSITFSLPFLTEVKVALALGGFAWVIGVMYKHKQLSRSKLFGMGADCNWRPMLFRFAVFAIFSALSVYIFLPEKFFIMPREFPVMWISIGIFYVVVSVFPQEVIYRQFFFWRYRALVTNRNAFFVLNACVFCLAHLMFWNNWVLALTLAGGFIFAHTYNRSRSVLFTSIEHSLYGVWLFTIGLGEMLAFPMPSQG